MVSPWHRLQPPLGWNNCPEVVLPSCSVSSHLQGIIASKPPEGEVHSREPVMFAFCGDGGLFLWLEQDGGPQQHLWLESC